MLRRSALVIALSLLVTGCATLTVSSHVERGSDFRQYHTYNWGPADGLPVGDPRLDNNPFFRDSFEGAVEKALAAKGLTMAHSRLPDLFIHYHANVTQKLMVADVDRGYRSCTEVHCEPQVIDFAQGTLVLDMVDARTNTLVWRGWAQQSVDGVIDNQDLMDKYITRGVAKMIARFPYPPQ